MIIPNSDFVHYHNHTSTGSLFDGASKVSELVKLARTMGFKALGVTDHGSVAAWLKFYKECKKKILGPDGNPIPEIKPILGIETYLAENRLHRGFEQQPRGKKGNTHLVLIAKNQKGYENICQLSQKSFLEGQAFGAPRVDFELLNEHKEGVICTSACLASIINQNLLHGRYDLAKAAAIMFKDIYGSDFYLSVMFHGIDAEGYIIEDIIRLSKELDIAITCENDCHYCKKEQADSHEVLVAMNSSKCLKDPKRYKYPHEFYLKSAEEMHKVFKSYPEFLYNTLDIADKVEDFLKIGGMKLPIFDVNEAKMEIGKTNIIPYDITDPVAHQKQAYEFVKELATEGLKDKLGWDKSEPHLNQLAIELEDVNVAWESNEMDMATYFLIVWEYVNWCRKQKIRVGYGRGSGGGSLILQSLGIIGKYDPLKGLYWERFLAFSERNEVKWKDWGIQSKDKIVPSQINIQDIKNELLNLESAKEYITDSSGAYTKEIDFWTSTLDEKENPLILSLYTQIKSGRVGDDNKYNSIVGYVTGLTSKKPEGEFKFKPTRFFARPGPPDIDMDFDIRKRHLVIEHLIDKYGRDFVGNIGTEGVLKIKSVITRVVKTLDLADSYHKGSKEYVTDNEAKAKEIKDSLPAFNGPGGSLVVHVNGEDVEIRSIKQLAEINAPELEGIQYYFKKYPDLLKYCIDLEGLTEKYGTHAAGICISPTPLSKIAPLRQSKKANGELMISTQWPLNDLEEVGLIKFDLLGIATLTIIDDCLALIKENYGIDLDIDKDVESWILNDPKTLEFYRTGSMIGVFQCEGWGMQKTIKEIQVSTFDDVSAAIALFRPGPMENIPAFCNRKNGIESISYFHSSLEPYLKPALEKTYGVVAYQEQIMQICEALGMNKTDALIVIKGIAKKQKDVMEKGREKLIKSAVKKGIDKDVIEKFWKEIIVPFGAYAFNFSHSAYYGVISLQTAYLKAHYPEEYLTACLNVSLEMSEHEDIEKYESDLKKMNIDLTKRNINNCGLKYEIISKKDPSKGIYKSQIRPPIYCKGLPTLAGIDIVKNQPYKTIRDFAERTDASNVSKDSIVALSDAQFFKSKKDDLIKEFTDYRNEIKTMRKRNLPTSGGLFGVK